MLDTSRECGRYREPQSQPHPDSPEQKSSGRVPTRPARGSLPTVVPGVEPQAWLGPPALAQPSLPHADPGLGQARTATHRTPSLRPKSSWSGSPLRWNTAMTPLWMLQGRGEERGPGAPSPPPPSPSQPSPLLHEQYPGLKQGACPHGTPSTPKPPVPSQPRGPGPQPQDGHPSRTSCVP